MRLRGLAADAGAPEALQLYMHFHQCGAPARLLALCCEAIAPSPTPPSFLPLASRSQIHNWSKDQTAGANIEFVAPAKAYVVNRGETTIIDLAQVSHPERMFQWGGGGA
jgi:hypothetical protein